MLGAVCLKLRDMQAEILRRLEHYTDLGTGVFLEGYDWEDDNAVNRLRSMMWGLESLKMLEDRTAASLKSISGARDTLLDNIGREPGRRHPILEQGCNHVIERFDKQREQLFILHNSLELKIRQVTGLRDGLSTVTNVQDSRTSVKQNSSKGLPQDLLASH